jgi:hypothetical protein
MKTTIAALIAAAAVTAFALHSRGWAQAPRPSQHGSVSQQVAGTTITIEYNRPVARGRTLFGSLVPYGRVWCPGADSCTTIQFSTDVKINGQALARGTYSLWAEPQADRWTVIFNSAQPVFHTRYPQDKDVLRSRSRRARVLTWRRSRSISRSSMATTRSWSCIGEPSSCPCRSMFREDFGRYFSAALNSRSWSPGGSKPARRTAVAICAQ